MEEPFVFLSYMRPWNKYQFFGGKVKTFICIFIVLVIIHHWTDLMQNCSSIDS